MLAYKLRHRITVQAQTVTQTANGAKSEGFVNWLTGEPARIYPRSARELFSANNEWPQCNYEVQVRWQPGYKTSMRLIDEAEPGGVVYNIRGIVPDPSLRQWITLVCESGVNDG